MVKHTALRSSLVALTTAVTSLASAQGPRAPAHMPPTMSSRDPKRYGVCASLELMSR